MRLSRDPVDMGGFGRHIVGCGGVLGVSWWEGLMGEVAWSGGAEGRAHNSH